MNTSLEMHCTQTLLPSALINIRTQDLLIADMLRACREASPGKLGAFEEDLFRTGELTDRVLVAAIALGVVDGHRTVGVAYYNAVGRSLGACQFAVDDHFCALEAVLVQLGAKEIVLPKVGHVPPVPQRKRGLQDGALCACALIQQAS